MFLQSDFLLTPNMRASGEKAMFQNEDEVNKKLKRTLIYVIAANLIALGSFCLGPQFVPTGSVFSASMLMMTPIVALI